MRTLLITQTRPDGLSRTWRLRARDGVATLGASRLADLPSVDSSSSGIMGAFHNQNDQWIWIPMGTDLEAAPVVLNEGTEIKLPESALSVRLLERETDLVGRLLADREGGDNRQERELEVLSHNGRVIRARLVGKSDPGPADTPKAPGLEVHRRKVSIESDRPLRRAPANTLDSETRRGALIVAAFGALFSLAAIFGPKAQPAVIAALPPLPPRMTVSLEAIKKPEAAPKQQPSSTAASATPSGTSARVAGAVSALQVGRVSKLLGKVSAHAAKSREVIVAHGKKAGEGSSARAMASLGQVDAGSGDWAAKGGRDVSVGTVGRGSGRGLAGVAGLQAGRTGSGGVGLIEDESDVSGGLDREVIAGIIRSQLGQILYCYERQLSAFPDLFGKVAVRFTIDATGAVESQKIGDTTLKNASVESCILSRVASWKFPTPKGGMKVQVTYPFMFKSTN